MKPNPLEILKIYNSRNRKLALQEISEDLEKIAQIKKCSFCGCNANTLKEFASIAYKQGEEDLADRTITLHNEINQKKRYDCIGCNPCYPADISNLLFKMDDEPSSEKRQPVSCGCSSTCSTEKSTHWPVEKGDYFVEKKTSPIAICTLANTDLPGQIHAKFGDKIAIVGYCETENIGIEKVIKNVISNSHIRYLILCGEESGLEMMGHLSGQAILSLHENGINEKGRIIAAKGKRPLLKNVDSEMAKQFQSQIELVNLIGSTSIDDIENAIHISLSKQTPRFEEKSVQVVTNNLITAQNPKRLVLDKRGFFVILPQKEENKIYIEYYANSGKLLHTIVGMDAPSIYYTIIEKGFVSKLDHAAYLGKELTKAEYSLKYDIPYTQDKALGELEVEQGT
jgi:tetrahydromethanopterin S-methyltransferase subunit A